MVTTKAGEALRCALDPANPARAMSQADLARALGVTQPPVSEWVRGLARPETHLRLAIERVLGIPAEEWLTDVERAVANGEAPPSTGTYG